MDRRGEERGEDRAGLVALGLIMELIGSVVAAYLIVKALEPVLDRVFTGRWYAGGSWDPYFDLGRGPGPRPPGWHVTLMAAVGGARALLHRRAGSAILYRHRDAAGPLLSYVVVAVLHAVLCLVVFWMDLNRQTLAWAALACISLAWPVALVLATRRPDLRRALRAGPAAPSGSAPAQVGTLMVFLGLVGVLVALLALYAAVGAIESWLQVLSVVPVVVASLLCVRSIAQVGVGLRLVAREPGSSEPLDLSRYVKLGLIAAALSWVAIMVVLQRLYWGQPSSHSSYGQLELGTGAMVVYLLFVWPLLLRRFARTRVSDQGEGLAAGRPSGRGALPALGWLLLAAGAVQVGVALLLLGFGESTARDLWAAVIYTPAGTGGGSRGPWLQLALAAPQLWVAVELLCGSARRRRAATLYAACASVVTVLSIRADMDFLTRSIDGGLPGPTNLLLFLPLAFSLVVPIATLVFVQHHLRREGEPAARASTQGGE